jgi:large subunit ribosomal protein L10
MEYKTRITPAKEEAVKALKDEFAQYDGYIFTDYRGMTVEQITKLRRSLIKKDAAYRVVKNRFARIAFSQLEKNADEQLVGPTAIALVKGDEPNKVAKDLYDIMKDGAPLSVKGGLIEGKFFTADEIEVLSKLPGRLELIASLMATMMAPVQKLAATLLAYVEQNGGSVESAEEKTEEQADEKAEVTAEEVAEAKVEEKAEEKAEDAAEAKVEKKTEPKADKKVEAKSEEKADAKAEVKTEKKAEEKAEEKK